MRWFLCLLLALCLSGCATLPKGVALEEQERRGIEAEFRAVIAAHQGEISCLDAEAAVTVQAWFRSGVINGYLQAQAPAALKFVGLDPLGRPLLALVTDGDSFSLAQVAEAKMYEGNTAAAGFRRYLPAGIDPADLFSWLTARPPLAQATISEVVRNRDGQGYWLALALPAGAPVSSRPGAAGLPAAGRMDAQEGAGASEAGRMPAENELLPDGSTPGPRMRVLFAPEAGLIRQVLVLDGDGRPRAELGYHDYQPLAGSAGALLPHRLELVNRQGNGGSMTITFTAATAACRFAAEEFRLRLPPGFELVQVNHES